MLIVLPVGVFLHIISQHINVSESMFCLYYKIHTLGYPLASNSRQDYYMFGGDSYKPSFGLISHYYWKGGQPNTYPKTVFSVAQKMVLGISHALLIKSPAQCSRHAWVSIRQDSSCRNLIATKTIPLELCSGSNGRNDDRVDGQ